jgi:hypothetical protein
MPTLKLANSRLQHLMQAALCVLETCREILVLVDTPPPALVEKLRSDTDELHKMSTVETERFSIASGVNFVITTRDSYSSGHVAAWCIGETVLRWIEQPGGRLSVEQLQILNIITNELGSQLQRERVRITELSPNGKYPWGDDDPEAPFPPATLAHRLGIPTDDRKRREALRKRLESWRNDHPSSVAGWLEVGGAAGRNPKYIYKIGKVWSVIEDMKPSG